MSVIPRWCWALMLAATDAVGAWLGVCPGDSAYPAAAVLETLAKPDGSAARLLVSDGALGGCEARELPVERRAVRWGRVITRGEAGRLEGGVILKHAGDGAALKVSEVIPLVEEASARRTLPVGEEILPLLRPAVFGDTRRARLRAAGERVVLECEPGASSAGLVLAARTARLPAGAHLALELGFSALGDFTMSGGATGGEFGLATSAGTKTGVRVELLPVPERALPASWLIGCPPGKATLEIHFARLVPGSGAGRVPPRSMWVWRPEAWQARPEELLTLLASHAADTVFITVPLTADRGRVAEPAALEAFISGAAGRGVHVWAVAGDARAVLPSERAAYVERARAYAEYNRAAPAAARLAGLQLDIEPYLNPGYHVDAEGWLAAYLETLAMVKPAAGMPLDVAVPFWWGDQRFRDGLFLDRLAPLVDVVTVMNYRTDRGQILDFAEPFLAWAARTQRRVRIGLEAGPIPDESLRVYRSRPEGELWLVPLGEQMLLVLLDAPARNPVGGAFAYSHTTRWRGSSITFRGNVDGLSGMLPGLEAVWRAWPSFAGVALHGLDAP